MDLSKALACGGAEAFRERLIDTLARCRFCVWSVERHRPVHGFYDYGLLGCSIKSNVLDLWHRHFVLEEQLPEVCCRYDKAERHVDDNCNVLMVLDGKTGTRYRADQLLRDLINHEHKSLSITAEKAEQLEELFENLYVLSPEELVAKMEDCGVTAPDTKNPLSEPCRLKLMLQTPIGESGFQPGKYTRPEAARRGRHFDNFKFLLEYNNAKLPCAGAYMSLAFSEEISSSPAALVVQEFTVAEIQHFVDPKDKTHRKFSAVADVEIFVFPRERQMSRQPSIKSRLRVAVSEGTIDNETLGYFIGRVFLFLTCLGIDKDCLRFRQRVWGEMARHATDCWVAEVLCSNGWIECVDIADWSSELAWKSEIALLDNEMLIDAREEVEKSGIALLDNGELIETRGGVKLEINEKELGHAFEGNQKIVVESLLAMSEEEALWMKAALEWRGEAALHVHRLGKTVIIKNNMVNFCKKRMREQKKAFVPSVIEPSFGIERIIHCLFEHFFYTRPSKAGDELVNVFRFPPLVAPIQCAVFQLRNKPEYKSAVKHISLALTAAGVCHRDYTAGDTIGKMYVKTDELGVPYAIFAYSQVDVTIRERDSKGQVRVSVWEAASVVMDLIDGQKTWSDVWSTFPHYTSASAEEDEQLSY